eukprot:TRINITY_DN9229_c0_g1_i1.p1 TRINITY_DN9229_c0_g1~~TRINITY_DN9229_c0_g1_i1.p1  ORF type:complete len:269 (-),score=55.18 TRINITY_DN9229_c0_g1_i1:83-889(-)
MEGLGRAVQGHRRAHNGRRRRRTPVPPCSARYVFGRQDAMVPSADGEQSRSADGHRQQSWQQQQRRSEVSDEQPMQNRERLQVQEQLEQSLQHLRQVHALQQQEGLSHVPTQQEVQMQQLGFTSLALATPMPLPMQMMLMPQSWDAAVQMATLAQAGFQPQAFYFLVVAITAPYSANNGTQAGDLGAETLKAFLQATRVDTIDRHAKLQTCPVCLDELQEGETARTLPCFHQLHDSCAQQYFGAPGVKPVCPLCRLDMRSPLGEPCCC